MFDIPFLSRATDMFSGILSLITFSISGGKLTGRMTFNGGAIVSASSGAIIDFDLTQLSAGAAALANDISVIQGAPLYTLTVDGQLTNGTKLTYTDGTNSVTVKGVTADRIELKFADRCTPDDVKAFNSLSAMCAFHDFTSERIFEKSKDEGYLAPSGNDPISDDDL